MIGTLLLILNRGEVGVLRIIAFFYVVHVLILEWSLVLIFLAVIGVILID